MEGRDVVRSVGFVGLCLVLTTSSCTCEDAIRRWISNPEGQQTQTVVSEEGDGDEQAGETEPNDSADEATGVDLGAGLEPVHGAIEQEGDTDWYALEAGDEPPWLVRLEVAPSAKPLDVALDVRMNGAEGGRTTYQIEGGGKAESVPILRVGKKTRHIAVRGADASTGAYKLSFERRLSGGAVESEPNDVRSSGVDFPFPGGIQGYYDRPGDRDFFKTGGETVEPGVYTVTVGAVPEFGHRADVFMDGAEGAADERYLSLSVPKGERRSIPNMAVPPDSAGLWFEMRAGESFDRKSPYRIRVVRHAPTDGYRLEREPNDSEKRSQKIGLTGEYRGYLHSPEDRDRFSVSVKPDASDDETATGAGSDAGTSEQASADVGTGQAAARGGGDASVAPPRRLGDEDMAEVKRGDADAGAGRRAGASDRAFVEEPTTIHDRLESKEAPDHIVQVGLRPERKKDVLELVWHNPKSGGKTRLTAEDPEAPTTLCNVPVDDGTLELEVSAERLGKGGFRSGFTYALALADVAEELEGLEIEPNDRRNAADPLEPDAPRTGYIARDGDRDVYGFLVPEPPTKTASETDEGDSKGEKEKRGQAQPGAPDEEEGASGRARPKPRSVSVKLTANRLDLSFRLTDAQGGMIADVDRAGAGANEQTSLDLPPGLYFVEVNSNRGSECRPYRVSVDVEGR